MNPSYPLVFEGLAGGGYSFPPDSPISENQSNQVRRGSHPEPFALAWPFLLVPGRSPLVCLGWDPANPVLVSSRKARTSRHNRDSAASIKNRCPIDRPMLGVDDVALWPKLRGRVGGGDRRAVADRDGPQKTVDSQDSKRTAEFIGRQPSEPNKRDRRSDRTLDGQLGYLCSLTYRCRGRRLARIGHITLRGQVTCAGKILAFGPTGPRLTTASALAWQRRSEESPRGPCCLPAAGWGKMRCERTDRAAETP